MSKLLIDEQPLQVQPSLAKALKSADEAIVLQQLHYWLQRTTRVQSDGHKWIYNSMANWLKQFPWISSRSTLSNYFNDLEKRGLIITGNFNKAKFDKTKWYRIDYDALSDLEQRLYKNQSTSDQNLDNGMSNNCTSNDQESDNGMSRNQSTYTNRLPETTHKITHETTTTESTGEKSFAKNNEYHLNFNKGDHLPKFLDLIDTLGDDLVCWAIQYTVDNANYPNWGYFLKVVKGLKDDEIKSVEEAEKRAEDFSQQHSQQRYRGRAPQVREKKPDWMTHLHKAPDPKLFDYPDDSKDVMPND